MKHILKTLLFLVGGILGGYLLLVVVFCLPTGRMHNNVIESAPAFNGDYKILISDNITTKTDDFTDALMLLTAENSSDRNPFTGSIYAYSLTHKELEPNLVITNIDNPENISSQYSRYWHGYLLFLKPLLLLFNYNQILLIVSFVVLALIVGVVYLLQKKKMSKYIIPYVATVALMSPMTISLSIQYVSVFAIFNLAMILILIFFDKILKTKNFFYVFLAVGMLTCYFDLLTYPIVTLGLPLSIWLLMVNRKKALSLGKNLGQVVLSSLAWAIGYFGIWVGKWALGSIITGKNLFGSAMEAAGSRTSSSAGLEEISRTFPITEAFDKVFTEPVCLILIVVVIVILIMAMMKKVKFSKEKALANLWLFAIAVIPLIWYMVFANHSAWHLFFTYRTLSVLIFAIGCYLVSVLESPQKINKRKEKDG